MSHEILHSINDKTINNEHVGMEYPHLYVKKYDHTLAVVIDSLPKGNLPVYASNRGRLLEIARIKKTATSIKPLIDIYTTELWLAYNHKVELNSIIDLMEVDEEFWMQ